MSTNKPANNIIKHIIYELNDHLYFEIETKMETNDWHVVDPWMWDGPHPEGDWACNFGWPVWRLNPLLAGITRGIADAASWYMIWLDRNNKPKIPAGICILSPPWIRFFMRTSTLTAKDARRVFEPWMQDSPPLDENVWVWRRRRAQKDYCKVWFSWVVVIDVWETSQRRTDSEDKKWFCSRSDFERLRDN